MNTRLLLEEIFNSITHGLGVLLVVVGVVTFSLLMLFGGIFYTLGTLFYSVRKIPFGPTIWHLFVLAGSACHFVAVYLL